MASGTVNTNAYDGRYYQFSWTSTPSTANNRSTISWTLKALGGVHSWYAERTLILTVAGGTPVNKTNRAERYTGTIASGSFYVNHDDDGTAAFAVDIKAAVYVSTVNCKATKTCPLDTIARKSTLSVADGTLGTAQTLTVTKQSSSFTHTIVATCGSASTTICTKSSSTSISFTPLIAWASQNTTGTSVSVKYTITTYNGNTSVGSTSYAKTCSIPASVKPSCSVAVTDAMGYADTYGGFIKGLSKFKVVVTPTTSYGSAIASYSTTANGSTYTAASFTTGILKSSGTLTVAATVKDKRGRSGSASKSLTVLNYSAPIIGLLKVKRCDSNGTENDQGEYVQVIFSTTATSLNSKNTIRHILHYKKTTSTAYTSITLSDYDDVYSVSNATYIFAADTGSSYDVMLEVTDDFKATAGKTVASTAFTLMHWSEGGTGLGIGKLAEKENLFDVGMPARFNSNVTGSVFGLGATDQIPENSDFNDYIVIGSYGVGGDTLAKTLVNRPCDFSGRLLVMTGLGTSITSIYNQYSYIVQLYISYKACMYIRQGYTSGTAGDWIFGNWKTIIE